MPQDVRSSFRASGQKTAQNVLKVCMSQKCLTLLEIKQSDFFLQNNKKLDPHNKAQ